MTTENPETTQLRALTDQLRASTAEMRADLTPEVLASLTDEQRAVLMHDLVLLGEVSSSVRREIEAHISKASPTFWRTAVAVYSDLASAQVPEPTRRRCDQVLLMLRSMDDSVTADELSERFGATVSEHADYSRGLARKDLHRLAGVGLVTSDYGQPEKWWAR